MKMKTTISVLLLALCVTSVSFAQSQMFVRYDFRANPGSEDAIAKILTDYHDQAGSYKSGGMSVVRLDVKGELETTHSIALLGEIDNFWLENPTPMTGMQFELLLGSIRNMRVRLALRRASHLDTSLKSQNWMQTRRLKKLFKRGCRKPWIYSQNLKR